MPCSWRASDLQLPLILTVILVAACLSAGVDVLVTSSNSTQQKGKDSSLVLPVDGKQNHSKPLTEVNISLQVLVNTKAELSCPTTPLTDVILITWEITLGDKLLCSRSYRRDKNETAGNCTDERIIWPYRPGQNSSLQTDPVAITHNRSYECTVVTPNGNFHYAYNLQLLVAPEMTLIQSENRTAVCKAVAGKPAAQISWTPEGECVSEHEIWGNGTVTVQSTCRWAESNVSLVSCSVSHETGNWSRSIQLNPGAKTPEILPIVYIILPIFIILIIMGLIWLLEITGCRKCNLKKTEPTPVIEEDEMQPYASYTEKSNPLYDTTMTVKTSQVLPSEVDVANLHNL
ncbi:cell surface glycoprotein CD200 receptor 1-like isoform X1 [Saccopteryx leptura]|uniref:cell surface glycoprotein CD200 receptor 1-like isoform X1 n=1 Tax=Saccopteryx leptura TaxID=249018 RepID=UPI00339CB81B